ncbi:unnamed protein product [Prunus brigantina]
MEETMPGEQIDRSLLWKKAREDKQGNIPDPKVVEKAKLIIMREETKKIEARANESVLEAVRAEREILLKQFSQLIPKFDPTCSIKLQLLQFLYVKSKTQKIQLCEMDKSCMHADRRSKAYELGVEGFLNFAVENLGNTTHIRCPCVKCGNIRLFGVGILRDHLYFKGIDQSYKIWTWHGEPWEWTTNASRNVGADEQSRISFVYEELGMDDNDLGDIGFANMIGDGVQPLYLGCSKYTMLSALVKLYNLKAKHGMRNA